MTKATLVEPTSGFHSLNLAPPLLEALTSASYHLPTPIQAALLPPACEGRDVIGQAQTGTGKTAAYLLPFFNTWIPQDGAGPQALVMCPTRELAVQVRDEARKLNPSPDCKVVAVYGGTGVRQQSNEVRAGCHVAVGTPGRMLDFIARGVLKLNRIRYVVLDEADRMLEIGRASCRERV